MPSSSLSRRSLIGLLSAAAAVACSPAQVTAPAGTPTAAPPTQAPAQSSTPAATGAAVVSRSGRVQLPTYVPPNSPAPDVPGGTLTPPGYTSYPQTLIRSVGDPPARGGQINI